MIPKDPFKKKRAAFEKDEHKNVFVIMRYGLEPPFAEIENTITETLQRFGLKAVVARDVSFHQQLWNNVRFCMDHSRYAIIVFERILEPAYNPNIAIELGYMIGLKRPRLILKDHSIQVLPTDIIGQLYTEFNSYKAKETIAVAIERWLEKLGHSSIKPAEVITASTEIEANIKRTRRIIAELSARTTDSTLLLNKLIVRQAATMSSLAISDKERYEDNKYHELLLEERKAMESLLKEGAVVRLIISPDTQVHRVRLKLTTTKFVRTNVLPRYAQMIATIKENLSRSNLQIVYVHRLPHDNLLIAGEDRVYIGRKRVRQQGFPNTTVIYDPTVVYTEISEFDILFNDSVGAIMGVKQPEQPQIEDYGSKSLKQKIIQRLMGAESEIQRLIKRPA
jgi:hypothetical protein